MSLFQAASEKLPGTRNGEGKLLTDGFLDACQLILPVIGAQGDHQLAAAAVGSTPSGSPRRLRAADQFGSGFALVKNDISGNLEVSPAALHGC
jgi:hypothetical protein